MIDTKKDIELVNRALAGSQSAWNEIVTENERSLYSIIYYSMSGIGYERSDIIQYFWRSIHATRLEKYNGKSPLNHWLKKELRASIGDLVKRNNNKHNTAFYIESNNCDDSVFMDSYKHIDSPENIMIYLQSLELLDEKGYLSNIDGPYGKKGLRTAKKLLN